MKVLVQFIQDRSGSMATGWEEAVKGFKTFIEELRLGATKDSIDYSISLTTFDTEIAEPLHEKALSEVTGDEMAVVSPRGYTALYDAVGKTLEATKQDGYEKIIVFIVTDGQENASAEWRKDALQKAIEAKINLGNWTFSYLGTQPETWADGAGLGMGVGAGATFNKQYTGQTYTVMGNLSNKMSASPVRGTRSFMSDEQYVEASDVQMMADAGMNVNDGSNPQPTTATIPQVTVPPADPPKAKTPDKKRWR